MYNYYAFFDNVCLQQYYAYLVSPSLPLAVAPLECPPIPRKSVDFSIPDGKATFLSCVNRHAFKMIFRITVRTCITPVSLNHNHNSPTP